VKPTLTLKPPKPHKPLEAPHLTKKERMKLDKEVIIQRENRIMLQKLLEIDHKRSELSKKKLKPAVFKIRSLSQTRGGGHP